MKRKTQNTKSELREHPEHRMVAKELRLTWQWKEPFFYGDCTLASPASTGGLMGPIVQLNPDGTGSFRSRVRSNDTGDHWHLRFEALDAAQKLLFHLPGKPGHPEQVGEWDKYIPSAGTWHDFNEDFTFPASMFGAVIFLSPYFVA